MTTTNALAVIDRMESDEAWAERVKAAGEEGGPEAALAILEAEGFAVTPDEMRDAFLDRFGDELTPEQLDAITGGISDGEFIAIAGGVILVAGAAAGAAV